jgi:hypothetical protein
MYLVEIKTGQERLYESVEDLAAAIHGGVIGPDARIFHRTSSSWISITLHPEYRKAMAARVTESLPPLRRSQWTFFGTEAPGREIDATMDSAGTETGPSEQAPRHRGLRALFSRRWRKQPADSAHETGT